MGILLKHGGGTMPAWLAPERVLALPMVDRGAFTPYSS
jgi:threonyl-tRNA synthetase